MSCIKMFWKIVLRFIKGKEKEKKSNAMSVDHVWLYFLNNIIQLKNENGSGLSMSVSFSYSPFFSYISTFHFSCVISNIPVFRCQPVLLRRPDPDVHCPRWKKKIEADSDHTTKGLDSHDSLGSRSAMWTATTTAFIRRVNGRKGLTWRLVWSSRLDLDSRASTETSHLFSDRQRSMSRVQIS